MSFLTLVLEQGAARFIHGMDGLFLIVAAIKAESEMSMSFLPEEL